MIRENQQLLNRLHVLSDGIILYAALPAAFWIRFYLLPGGFISVPLDRYLILGVFLTAAQLFTYAAFGLYQSFRRIRLRKELEKLWLATALVMAILLSALFVQHYINYSRLTLAIWSVLSLGILSCKRFFLRRALRCFRQKGYNQKRVLVLGCGELAQTYLKTIRGNRELGYLPVGYIASRKENLNLKRLGGFEELEELLDIHRPDEVVSAIGTEDYQRMPEIIAACEKTGTKLSIIPFYAKYMPSNPQFDELEGIPLLNFRRIPLDNWEIGRAHV